MRELLPDLLTNSGVPKLFLRELGFKGAMAVQDGYVDAQFFRKTAEEAFRVPRVGYPGRFRNLVQRITGVDRFRELFRSEG